MLLEKEVSVTDIDMESSDVVMGSLASGMPMIVGIGRIEQVVGGVIDGVGCAVGVVATSSIFAKAVDLPTFHVAGGYADATTVFEPLCAAPVSRDNRNFAAPVTDDGC